MKLSQKLAAWSEEFDHIFNHVLGYVIAFTSLVAFADVLGNGQVSEHLPILYWVWLFAQGLCVEFQVFVLIKRMPGYWQSNRLMFGVYGTFIGCLCLMSVLVGSVFVQHDQAGGSIEQAMADLGIPHIGFIYARAALAILLVALIAVDRAIEQHRRTESERLQEGEHQRTEQRLEEMFAPFAHTLEHLAVRQTELTAALLQVTEVVTELRDTPHLQLTQESSAVHSEVESEQDEDTLEQRIRQHLAVFPDSSVRVIAMSVRCSPSTASKWAQRIRSEHQTA